MQSNATPVIAFECVTEVKLTFVSLKVKEWTGFILNTKLFKQSAKAEDSVR